METDGGPPSEVSQISTASLADDCERKKARAFLRERFIRAVLAMNGKMATFHMYENTNVSAEFGSCDREFVNIYVKKLQTPLGTLTDAVLRTNDMDRICINDINPSE